MEAKKNSCLSRLPRLRVGLVMLVAASSTLTLIVINLTDQWVSQSFTQLERKPGRNRNHFGAAFDMMRSHDKKDKLGGLAWPSRDPRLSSRKRVHDKDLLLGNLTRRFSTERADTDAPDMATAWHQTLKTNDQTAVEQTGAVIQGATRGGPTILPRVDNTGFTLQATKRSEMKKNAHKLRSNRAVLRRNLYDWNDRDPLAYKTLPLRNGTESNQWERTEAIIFNRVPKCGSRSVVDLLRKLSAKNDFNLISSLVHNMSVKSQAWPKRLARTLDIVKTPYLFQRHFHYFNFSQFNAREPLYINIIRDPLARMVSAYYFKRFGDSHLKPHFKGTEEEKYRELDIISEYCSYCKGVNSYFKRSVTYLAGKYLMLKRLERH